MYTTGFQLFPTQPETLTVGLPNYHAATTETTPFATMLHASTVGVAVGPNSELL